MEALTVNPGYNEAEREMDAYYRFHAIRRLLRYFQPLYTHIDIEQRISCSIRQGYLGRNPIYSRNERYLGKTTALGFTIIGMSGGRENDRSGKGAVAVSAMHHAYAV